MKVIKGKILTAFLQITFAFPIYSIPIFLKITSFTSPLQKCRKMSMHFLAFQNIPRFFSPQILHFLRVLHPPPSLSLR